MVRPGVSEIVGVYDADAGLLGEASYLWGRWRGTRHCSLCDITHSPIRRKREWDRMVAGLPVPVRLLHLNELDDELTAQVARAGAPSVLARVGHEWRVVADGDALAAADGSVDRLGTLVRDWLAGAGEPT